MRALGLALRTLAREWKSGELGILLLALTVAVGALTGVGFLVSRISGAVDMQAAEVLAADIRLESPDALSSRYIDEAGRRGLASATSTGTLSVVFNGERSQLASLRAVSDAYPLRGVVRITDVPFGTSRPATGVPPRGELWADSKLLAAIGADVGSSLSIGALTLRATRVLVSRPDQGSNFIDLSPNVLMNAADLEATELLQPGSRAQYAMLFAGESGKVADFKLWLEANKDERERLQDVTEASPQIDNASDRAGRFLSLASLVSVLLCAIAVAMAARRYVTRHLDAVALLKTLGATRAFILTVSMSQLFVIAVVAAVFGSIIGYFAQLWILAALRDLIVTELPTTSWEPVGMGFLTAIAVLAGFALPPLLQLAQVPAIRVLRRDAGTPRPLVWLAFAPAVLAIGLLIAWTVREWQLFIGFTSGLTIFIVVLALAGAILVRATSSLRGSVGVAWRYGVANLSRRRAESVIQIVAFGLGIMVLLLLALVRRDLLEDWRKSLPVDVPNFFFINIPPDDRTEFMSFLDAQGAQTSRALPMIRARMIEINGESLTTKKFVNSRGDGLANREQNITWSSELGADNRIIAGRWWRPEDIGKPLVSIASEFQDSVGIGIGDKLTFDVAGETYEVTVASIREVKWDSFQPNFFLVFPPGLLDETVGTWMTSAYFPAGKPRPLAELVRRFPSVSAFDLDELLGQVRSVIDKAALAVQSVFVFTLFAGLTVLLAAVQASRDERRYESAMLRTLGASRATVRNGVLAEFTTLGVLAGVLAAGGASIAGYFIATRVLDVHYTFDAWVWLWGLCGGAVIVAGSGWLATRSVVSQSPVTTLRGQ